MLGKIISIDESELEVELTFSVNQLNSSINNMYILIADKSINYIGEITKIKGNIAFISILGQYADGKFIYGFSIKPSFSSKVDLISIDFVNKIIGMENETAELYFGNNDIYKDIRIGANINNFFGHHFAFMGSSGSGKSCGFAKVIQNLFNRDVFPKNSNIFVFDSYGEYHNAFKNMPNCNFKSLTTNFKSLDEKVNIPIWLLEVDDLALLLGVKKESQLLVLEKALKFLDVFSRKDLDALKHKNSIIANALLEIIVSGRNSGQIRDQFVSVLTKYNTPQLNLETRVLQPGYTRTLRQCLLIDDSGKIRAIELITQFLSKYLIPNVSLRLPDKSYPYSLNDISYALDFALIDEGVLRNEVLYNDIYYLKSHLNTLCSSETAKYFDCFQYISPDDYIKKLTMINGQKAQIINININYVDDLFAKVIVKIYSKMIFEHCKNMENRGTMPFHIILEEAHRYVQNDSDRKIIGYNIFDRIAKEGRKYGILLGLISQRPTELSSTCLSQCNNYVLFKMLHPKDLEFIAGIVPNISEEGIRKMKTLKPGSCMVFGTAFKMPTLIKIDIPNPMPSSPNSDIQKNWF